jgi:putative oxidoreductase
MSPGANAIPGLKDDRGTAGLPVRLFEQGEVIMRTNQAFPIQMVGNPVPNKGINVTLWIMQALLAIAFGMAGLMHATKPIPELSKTMGWTGNAPEALVRFIGLAELAGAMGLILPGLTRIKPGLTAWAATGLAIMMVFASFVHVSRNEASTLPVNVVLGGLAAFVAWGRFRKAPMVPRA